MEENLIKQIGLLFVDFKKELKEEISKEMNAMENRIYARIIVENTKLEKKINARFDRLEERVERLEEKVEKLEDRIRRLEEKVEKLEERVENLEQRVDILDSKFDSLNSFVMSDKKQNLEKFKRINDIDYRVEKNESDIMLCHNEVLEIKKSMV